MVCDGELLREVVRLEPDAEAEELEEPVILVIVNVGLVFPEFP